MASVLRASAAITKANRPRGYQDFTRQEMDTIMQNPLSNEDYKKADRIMFLLMKTQVRTFLDSQPGGKEKVKIIRVNSGGLSSRHLTTRFNYVPKDVQKCKRTRNGKRVQQSNLSMHLKMPST